MRALSLALASSAALVGLVFPFLLARQATGANQSVLLLMLAGTIGAFIYGAGFRPANRVVRLATTPLLTWALIIGGATILMTLR